MLYHRHQIARQGHKSGDPRQSWPQQHVGFDYESTALLDWSHGLHGELPDSKVVLQGYRNTG